MTVYYNILLSLPCFLKSELTILIQLFTLSYKIFNEIHI